MVNSGKTGRPARPGERYPSGNRKDPDSQRANAVWRRLVEDGELLGADPRLSSQIGRLRLHRELTDSQAAAADLVGRTYGNYERLHGKRRTTRSPSYEFSTGGGRDMPEDADDIAYARDVNETFARLQECIPVFPREARRVIEDLCCEDRHIMPVYLNDVRAVLNRIVEEFELGPAPLVLEVKSVSLPPLRRPRFRKRRPIDEGLATTLARTTTSKPVRLSRSERFEKGEFADCPASSVPSAIITDPKAIADRERTERAIAENARRALEGGEAPA